MPMARLAEYMKEVADLIGERASVHFVELESGSVKLVHEVQHEAYQKVEARVASIHSETAPHDAINAYRALNKKLAEDNTSASYEDATTGATILDFPGVNVPKIIEIKPVSQPGTIDGQVIQVGGRQVRNKVPVLIDTGENVVSCVTSRDLAKQLRNFFLEERRRFHGNAEWTRNELGNWEIKRFEINNYEQLEQRPLSALIDDLRGVPSQISNINDVWEDLMNQRDIEGELH